jgi:cell shape-determining protein MreC
MRGINGALETLGNIYYYVINTRAEINKLKSDNFNLRRRLMGFDYIKKENGELKQIVNMVADENISEYKTTRLNILDISPYSNRVSINYGLADELSEGNFILDVEGNLIGRVINVQKNRSEALLITDPRSKIIAQSEKSKINLILSGNGEKMLNIEYIDGEEYNFKNGERIFVSTEKDGRNNFDVGVLVKAKSGTTVKISSNFNKINYGIILLGISDK